MGVAPFLYTGHSRQSTSSEALPILGPVSRKLTALFRKGNPEPPTPVPPPSPQNSAVIEAPEKPPSRPGVSQSTTPSLNGAASIGPPRKRRRRRKRARTSASTPSTNGVEQTPIRSDAGHFGKIPVSGPLAQALESMGYSEPTPIQEEVIPLVQAGRDLVGQAQTGTGKTASFGIPLVEMLNPQSKDIQALILVPTRELAMQVREEISRLGRFRGIQSVAVYGGQAMSTQLMAFQRGVHIIVATPGRLMDHMERGTLRLDRLRVVVLDEADQMLDIGFAPDIEYILRHTPRSRQTLLFSATMPGPIRRLANRYLQGPSWIRVGGDAEPVEQVDQIYYEVSERERPALLEKLLEDPGRITQALIFRRTKVGVDRLETHLRRRGYDAQAIHGDMTQAQRNAVMGRFRTKDLRILVATNVAARGLDIPAVSHVINYDMPDNLEEYVHRIGRTARMGRPGVAIIFVSEWDFPALDVIQAHVGEDLKQEQLVPVHS